MSRRSGRLQARNENVDVENQCPSAVPVRKRKAEEAKLSQDKPDAKRQNFEIQGCWSQITAGAITPCVLVETPQKESPDTPDVSRFTRYRFQNLFINPSPLPDLSWGSSKDVWLKMISKEHKYIHSSQLLKSHKQLTPDMRSILIDWLMEVSEVYSLHRETFYLAQDFFDRFMLTQTSVNKSRLQLIGVACLFIASKIEEIYPPKLHDFAYVTDGACTEDEIVHIELIILKALKWELCPMTAIAWLNLYLQVSVVKESPKLLLPHYSPQQFIQITQLLDLCIIHITSLDFKYRILAASALYHFTSMEVVAKATGLNWEDISQCVEWMNPFMQEVQKNPPVKLKVFKKVSADDQHNIQTHAHYLDMLNTVKVNTAVVVPEQSPVVVTGILTPPKSTEKTQIL